MPKSKDRILSSKQQKETDQGKHKKGNKVWLRTRHRIRRKLLSR